MNESQKSFLAKARQKLRVAEDLLDLGHWDDAVSRAYYSMFYAAEALLEGEGLRFQDGRQYPSPPTVTPDFR